MKKLILLSFFLYSCTTSLNRKVDSIQDVCLDDGINLNESSFLAWKYFRYYINGCGTLDEIGLYKNKLWAFNPYVGIDGSDHRDTFFIDKVTGDIVTHTGKQIISFLELKEKIQKHENLTSKSTEF